MPRTFFITGTDTGVGKTYVTCAIAKSLRASGTSVGIYKPVCSGAVDTPAGKCWDDIELACAALGASALRELICPQRFLAPVAPPVAARQEGKAVDEQLLLEGYKVWQQRLSSDSVLLIEGAGGWLSPLSDHWTCADFARQLNVPVIVVAPQKLGVINHTLLTLESIRSRGLTPAVVVLNSVTPVNEQCSSSNAEEISHRGAIDSVVCLPHNGELPRRLVKWVTDSIPVSKSEGDTQA